MYSLRQPDPPLFWPLLRLVDFDISFKLFVVFFFFKILPCFSTSGKIPPAYLSLSLSLFFFPYILCEVLTKDIEEFAVPKRDKKDKTISVAGRNSLPCDLPF